MLLLIALACTSGDKLPLDDSTDDSSGDSVPPDPETVPLDGVCSDATHWGAFLIDSNADFSFVSGAMTNGVVPASILTNVLTDGECTIWRRENPFCDPACTSGFACDFDGECVPYPEGQDIGTVTVHGLVQPVSMTPVPPGNTYFDTSLPNPPWEPGALVTLGTSGGAYDPFRLYGVAPATLVPTSLAWTINPGQPLAISWDAPTSAVRSEVVLNLRIDLHGVTPSSLECVFADDGAAEVPASVLDQLMAAGVTGFPAGDIARRTADSADAGQGCADLVLTSSRLGQVSITGYTPCRRDEECPEGTTCNEALERCE